MNKQKLLTLLLPLALLFGCKTKTAVEPSAPSIVGSWVWEESSFVARGLEEPKISNPESRGYSIQINVREAEIDIMKDGKFAATVPYKLLQMEENLAAIEVNIPQDSFPFFIASGPITISDTELLISGGYNDAGENQRYSRKK